MVPRSSTVRTRMDIIRATLAAAAAPLPRRPSQCASSSRLLRLGPPGSTPRSLRRGHHAQLSHSVCVRRCWCRHQHRRLLRRGRRPQCWRRLARHDGGHGRQRQDHGGSFRRCSPRHKAHAPRAPRQFVSGECGSCGRRSSVPPTAEWAYSADQQSLAFSIAAVARVPAVLYSPAQTEGAAARLHSLLSSDCCLPGLTAWLPCCVRVLLCCPALPQAARRKDGETDPGAALSRALNVAFTGGSVMGVASTHAAPQ